MTPQEQEVADVGNSASAGPTMEPNVGSPAPNEAELDAAWAESAQGEPVGTVPPPSHTAEIGAHTAATQSDAPAAEAEGDEAGDDDAGESEGEGEGEGGEAAEAEAGEGGAPGTPKKKRRRRRRKKKGAEGGAAAAPG
nr:hypothetical protein [Myxococcota bacterium]